MQVDTDISEEYTFSIFKVEMCRFKNGLGYIGELQGKDFVLCDTE
jgi:hypothetical protein